MTIGRFDAPRDKPFFWWGATERIQPVPTLADLIQRGSIGEEQAAVLLLLIERGASIFTISEASGAGKSTLLASLVEASVPSRKRIYLRGNYETFDFLGTAGPAQTVLLLNEISPHLPAYLWGTGVHRVLDCMRQGYQILGTAHAASGPAFIQLLTSPPLRVPVDAAIQAYTIVRLADPGVSESGLLHVASIAGIIPGPEPGSFRVDKIEGTDQDSLVAFASRVLVAANLDATGTGERLIALRSRLETRSKDSLR